MADTMKGYLFVAIIVALLILGAIVRFSIVSPLRTRKSRELLRAPDLEGVARLSGLQLPEELARLYREAAFIERSECELVDTSKFPSVRWAIGAFNALTPDTVREWRSIAGVRGVPIATDLDKGVYFVDEAGAVVLASPNVMGNRVVVASTVDAFSSFQAQNIPDTES